MIGYVLFLLVMATLLVRPTDFHPSLWYVPLYEMLIVPGILANLGVLAEELSPERLMRSPITVCVLGMWAVGSVSGVLAGAPLAEDYVTEIGKLVVMYLMVTATVTTVGRLRGLLAAIILSTLVAVGMASLDYHGYIHLQAAMMQVIENVDTSRVDYSTGSYVVERRMTGTGSFSDPNDICENIAVALALGGGLILEGRSKLRWLWLVPGAFLAHATTLTQSRGGLLAVVAGLGALLQSRLRGRRGMILTVAACLVLMTAVGGRQGSIDFSGGSGRGRLDLWLEAIPMLMRSPLLGVGPGQFGTYARHVAHNSTVQAYAEMGLLGGTLYFGAFYYALTTIWKLGRARGAGAGGPPVRRLQPAVLGAVVAFTTGELALTHVNGAMPMVVLGLASAYIRLAQPEPPPADSLLSAGLLGKFAVRGMMFVCALLLFAKVKAHWGY